MTINAEKWFSSDWALKKGLYTEVFENNELMDSEIELFTQRISNYNPEAMKRLKKIFGKILIIGINYLNKELKTVVS